MIHAVDDNVWSITLVGKADGRVVISYVQAPKELRELLIQALKFKALVVPSGQAT